MISTQSPMFILSLKIKMTWIFINPAFLVFLTNIWLNVHVIEGSSISNEGCYLLFDRTKQTFLTMTSKEVGPMSENIVVCDNKGPGSINDRQCFVKVLYSAGISGERCRLERNGQLSLCAVIYRNDGTYVDQFYCKEHIQVS